MAPDHTMPPPMPTSERSEHVAGVTTRWHEAPGNPILYLHGVPTDAGDWLPFLERTGGYAPDLPGFGRSDKPPHFDYSIPGYTHWLRAYVDAVGLDRFSLVTHDWGVVGLALAQEIPERVDRLVVIDGVPLLPGYTWHRAARLWRRPIVGEWAMGVTFKFTLRRGGVPEQLLDRAYAHFDHGTQRAILKLYRSAPPQTLAAAGARLGEVRSRALVVWGEDDEFIPARFAEAYREAPGGDTTSMVVPGARHWPWIDRPDVVDTVTAFLVDP